MKKTMKKALLMVALLAAPLAMQAQTKFHDVEANEATGPVKSMTVSVMGNSETINFSPEGKMEKEGMTDVVYDENGYMQSAKIEIQGMQAEAKYTWKDGKVVGNTINIMGQEMSTTCTYNDHGAPLTETLSVAGQLMVSAYSDYQYDDHGNWISRKGSMMGQSMDQTRTIEYYE